jgi:hypothetical protein
MLMFVGYAVAAPLFAHWDKQEDELPEWGQRGELVFSYFDGEAVSSNTVYWKMVAHLHGPRVIDDAMVQKRVEMGIPNNCRLEAVMFFGTDDIVKRQQGLYKNARVRFDHDWYWHLNWFARDPKFKEAALIMRDGRPMIEYKGHKLTEREMGNPLSPMLWRMREEQSRAVLTPHDPYSPANAIYPNLPYTPENDDINFGTHTNKPFEYYPVFGYLCSLWYDNPQIWEDSSELSQAAWRKHFKEKFGVEIVDPASHPNDLVRREWSRFWMDAYGQYFEKYFGFHQANIKNCSPKIKPLTTALNGQQVCPVMLNASKGTHPWGANQAYLFNRYKGFSYPGVLCEYSEDCTYGKAIMTIKFAMAFMHGRPTGSYGGGRNVNIAESLAANGAITVYHNGLPDYQTFKSDIRFLLVNAQPANRVGILYNIRSGLIASTYMRTLDLGQQMDEIGVTYDALIEDDLLDKNADCLAGYKAVLVPGGEFNEAEIAGFKRYVENGGHLIILGDVQIEQEQYMKLASADPKPMPFRPSIPLAKAFGQDSFNDAELKAGKGVVTVCEDQLIPNARLKDILKPELESCFRLQDPKGGQVGANVLRQPRQGDALIIGLLNYEGEIQKNVRVILPSDVKPPSAAVISPDGYAQELKMSDGGITVPELNIYSAVVLGTPEVTKAALAAIMPRVASFVVTNRLAPTALRYGKSSQIPRQKKIEDVPADKQLARVAEGRNESCLACWMDVLAPKQAKKGQPVRVEMNMIIPGTHGLKAMTMEYWRLHAVNIKTGEEVMSRPEGAKEDIQGAPVFLLKDGKAVPMPYMGPELQNTTLVGDLVFDKPGEYQIYADFLYNVGGPNFEFTMGDAGPRVEPAFPGDRPDAGWGYPGKPLKKHYVKLSFPRIVIGVE